MKTSFGAVFRRNLAGIATSVTLTASIQGCTPAKFGNLEVEQQSSPPVAVEVSDSGVTIPLGIAVRLKVKPVSDSSQQYTSNDKLRFESNNRSVAGVFQLGETSQVVLTGARVGSTCMRVMVNHQQVDCLRLTVVEQEVPPSRDR